MVAAGLLLKGLWCSLVQCAGDEASTSREIASAFLSASSPAAPPREDAVTSDGRRLQEDPTEWIKAGERAQTMCVGLPSECLSTEKCTLYAFGPCGGLDKPTTHFEARVEALGLIDDSEAYLGNPNEVTFLTSSEIANNLYREYNKDLRQGGATYSHFSNGAWYGPDPRVHGAYLGTASYVLQNGTIKTNSTLLIAPETPGSAEAGFYQACISDLDSDLCGSPRSFTAGSFKFALFGVTSGSASIATSGKTHLVIRMKLSLRGLPAALTLNDGKTLDNIFSTDVTSLTVTEMRSAASARQFKIMFPPTYNVGDATTGGFATPSATKGIKIKVSRVPGESSSIYTDYLFEITSTRNTYFIYCLNVVDETQTSEAQGMFLVLSDAVLVYTVLVVVGVASVAGLLRGLGDDCRASLLRGLLND
jgi:hypothetical protein